MRWLRLLNPWRHKRLEEAVLDVGHGLSVCREQIRTGRDLRIHPSWIDAWIQKLDRALRW